jgi:ABC-type glycerol-3-phosphate transport system permease component
VDHEDLHDHQVPAVHTPVRRVEYELVRFAGPKAASSRVLPLQLVSFETEFGVKVPGVLAAVVLATIPMVLVFIVGYRFLVRGLAAGLSAGGAVR